MNLLKHVNGFFSTVDYTTARHVPACEDNSWSGKAESWANTCQKPARWVTNQLWSGGRSYCIILKNDKVRKVGERDVNSVAGFKGVARSVAGLVLSVPGLIASIPLMGFAYVASPEIRLKHRVVAVGLTAEDKDKLNQMIADRQKLAAGKEECEPVTCFLGTIACLLCYIVCYNKD